MIYSIFSFECLIGGKKNINILNIIFIMINLFYVVSGFVNTWRGLHYGWPFVFTCQDMDIYIYIYIYISQS
jgi:hypothetical protein